MELVGGLLAILAAGAMALASGPPPVDRGYPPPGVTVIGFATAKVNATNRDSEARIRRAVEALKKVEAGHLVDRQMTEMSSGESRRILVARALIHHPKMLLLDEQTEGLAPVIVQRIGELLATLKKRGMTILLVEQNFRFAARIADRFYLMEHGKVVEGFAVSELSAHTGQLHEVLGV